ncbi:MAG: hypothetical protein U5Q44_12010 [Dehalococcoidia bacterium]|nr:hypothetical protein [Dehalococcoidia bacterium]
MVTSQFTSLLAGTVKLTVAPSTVSSTFEQETESSCQRGRPVRSSVNSKAEPAGTVKDSDPSWFSEKAPSVEEKGKATSGEMVFPEASTVSLVMVTVVVLRVLTMVQT